MIARGVCTRPRLSHKLLLAETYQGAEEVGQEVSELKVNPCNHVQRHDEQDKGSVDKGHVQNCP